MMIRGAVVAGLVGLGLVGSGTGAVVYGGSGGTPTVTVKDGAGKGHDAKVKLPTKGGTLSCPEDIESKLEPHDVTLGRMKVTMNGIEHKAKVMQRKYKDGAPESVRANYRHMMKRYDRISDAYNAEVDVRNGILDKVCSDA